MYVALSRGSSASVMLALGKLHCWHTRYFQDCESHSNAWPGMIEASGVVSAENYPRATHSLDMSWGTRGVARTEVLHTDAPWWAINATPYRSRRALREPSPTTRAFAAISKISQTSSSMRATNTTKHKCRVITSYV